MSVRPDAIVFDLDGTLVDSVADSVADLADALSAFLADYGFAPIAGNVLRRWMGGNAADLITGIMEHQSAVLPDGYALHAVATEFLAYYDRYPVVRTVLFDGAAELLETVRAQGIAIAVCTNKREALSRDILAAVGVGDYVAVVVGADTLGIEKPDPAMLHHVLLLIGVPAARTWLVGDSVNDIEMARRAGVARVIGAGYGYPRRPDELDSADLVVTSLRELLPELRR